jgi:epsilon-lactone hydrolase
MTLRLQLLRFWLRRFEKPALARVAPLVAREQFEKQGQKFPDPPFALYSEDRFGELPVTWVAARVRRPGVILWIHGGAHVTGSPRTHRAMVARLCAMTGLRGCLPDYRLAPEHPFPASLEDSEAAWDGLRALAYAPAEILLGGDSSGGGVMLALLALLLARGERPAAAIAIAPFTDLTGESPSFRENAEADPFLPAERLGEVQDLFLAGADPRDPRASPIFARFEGAPPVFLQVARTEILRDDSLRMARLLEGQGVEVELDLWDDCPHSWAMCQGFLPEADAALRNIARFIRARCPAPTPAGS